MTKKRNRRWMTLKEHDELLKAEGRYEQMLEQQRRDEEERQKRVAEWRRAEAPLVEELRKAGFDVETSWDLVNTPTPYPEALPILLEHVGRPYPDAVREGIARALAVPDAKFGWPVLTELYEHEQNERAKDGLAVAIAAIADDEVIDDVIKLARDTRHGDSRLLLLSALERSRVPRARATLMELGTDPDLYKEIQVILRRRRRRRGTKR